MCLRLNIWTFDLMLNKKSIKIKLRSNHLLLNLITSSTVKLYSGTEFLFHQNIPIMLLWMGLDGNINNSSPFPLLFFAAVTVTTFHPLPDPHHTSSISAVSM